MKTLQLTAVLEKEEDGYVSLCPELDIASQGDSVEEATANLKEAVELFLVRSPLRDEAALSPAGFRHAL